MTQIFQREIAKLRAMILELGGLVIEAVRQAVRAVETRETALARAVIDGDHRIDDKEVEVEEECLKILALHQPVAMDLRFIVAVLKMNSDLERIGDKAAGIAKRAIRLAELPSAETGIDFHAMSEKVLAMFSDSLTALVELDAVRARRVCESDAEINALDEANIGRLRHLMTTHPDQVEVFGRLLEISGSLERIADHATNIAEDVIYMVEGAIVRHHRGEAAGDSPR